MAGGFGQYIAEWLQTLFVLLASVWWFLSFTASLPILAISRVVSRKEPKEFSSILITGASSGIGAALARSYARRGVKLVLTARRAEKLAEVKQACECLGASVKTLSVDVNDKDDMNKQISMVDDEWPLDLVIANAGVDESTYMLQGKDALDLDTQAGVISTNCLGVVHTVAPIASRMQKRGHGQIVIMSSVASIMPGPLSGTCAYASSKIWARSYGLGLRGALASSGVGVSVICPAFVDSDMADGIAATQGWVIKLLHKSTVISARTMVERTKEAIADDVAEFFVPFGFMMMNSYMYALNVLPPTVRVALTPFWQQVFRPVQNLA